MSQYFAGTIRYAGPAGETGCERFESIPHARGRTLRAICELDDVGITRDVTYALDADSWPRDAFVRVIEHGVVTGSTLFVVEPGGVRCDGVTAEHGRVSQFQRLDAPLAYLGLHPLVGDGLIATCRGRDRRGEFVPVPGMTNSFAPNGERGLLAMPISIDVAYLGPEDIEVPAGRFAAERYALRWQPQWPAADLWVAGDDALFLRLTWSLLDVRYDLVELHTSR